MIIIIVMQFIRNVCAGQIIGLYDNIIIIYSYCVLLYSKAFTPTLNF